MDNFQGKRKPTTISVSLFATFSESFSLEKPPAKSPRNFRGGGVGLGIVAAMTESRGLTEGLGSSDGGFSVSPRSMPIPIVSSAKAAANFRGGLNLGCDGDGGGDDDVDESSESYKCVISHRGEHSVTRRVYFDGKLNGVSEDCIVVASGVFSASPASVGEMEMEFWSSDFLSSCFLCKKQLHGLDIFMYRGEMAFCSWECRDKHIRSEDYKDKCRPEAKKAVDYSASPCSSPQVFLAGVAAA